MPGVGAALAIGVLMVGENEAAEACDFASAPAGSACAKFSGKECHDCSSLDFPPHTGNLPVHVLHAHVPRQSTGTACS